MMLPAPQIRSIPTQEILRGLARLHPFVLLVDREGGIAWMSAGLREYLCDAATGPAGQELGEGREHLLESLVAHLPHPEQLDALREHLLRDERAGRVRLDLATPGGVRLSVEASAFAPDQGSVAPFGGDGSPDPDRDPA